MNKAIERLKAAKQSIVNHSYCLEVFGQFAADMDLAIAALRAQAEREKPPVALTLEQLRERVGRPVWATNYNRWGIIGERRVGEDESLLVIGFAYGWEWLADITQFCNLYDRPPEKEKI